MIKSRNFESAYSYQVSIISANKAIGQKEEFVRNILQNELDYLKSNGKDMNIQKKDELIEKIEKRLNEWVGLLVNKVSKVSIVDFEL